MFWENDDIIKSKKYATPQKNHLFRIGHPCHQLGLILKRIFKIHDFSFFPGPLESLDCGGEEKNNPGRLTFETKRNSDGDGVHSCQSINQNTNFHEIFMRQFFLTPNPRGGILAQRKTLNHSEINNARTFK